MKTILCFGDSNTHGYCAETGGRIDYNRRFPYLLQSYLGTNYIVTDEGLSGRTTVFDDPLHEGLNGLSSIHISLMSHEPIDCLVIMLGTNDTKERFGATPSNISKGLERLIKKAQSVTEAWNGRQNIIVVAPPPIEDGYIETFVGVDMGENCSAKSRELAYYYDKVALQNQCHFIDAGRISNIKMHENDYMHLTIESHELLAKSIYNYMMDHDI